MRKARFLSLLLILCLASVSVLADGVTLRTVSSFAGANPAAEAYLDTLKAYEARTGNTVVDVSAASDETWKTSVLQDFAAGNEPDVLFFFAAGADSAPILSRVVPIAEINAAYPENPLPENEARPFLLGRAVSEHGPLRAVRRSAARGLEQLYGGGPDFSRSRNRSGRGLSFRYSPLSGGVRPAGLRLSGGTERQAPDAGGGSRVLVQGHGADP